MPQLVVGVDLLAIAECVGDAQIQVRRTLRVPFPARGGIPSAVRVGIDAASVEPVVVREVDVPARRAVTQCHAIRAFVSDGLPVAVAVDLARGVM